MMDLFTGLGPFDLQGRAFLALYSALLLMAAIASIALPRWLRPEGRSVTEKDPDALAYLAGGTPRMAESLVVELLEAKALVMEGRDKLRIVASATAQRSASRAILALSSPASWSAVSRAAVMPAASIRQRLIRSGLMIDDATAMQLRFWQTLPYLLFIGFGTIKWQIGVLRDKPVGLLTALLIVTAVIALLRFIAVDRRTGAGMAALARTRAQYERLRRAPASGETALGVALFGTTVLVGSAWSDFHRMRTTSGADGSFSASDGSSDGGGSSGCGGGGCGGCGS